MNKKKINKNKIIQEVSTFFDYLFNSGKISGTFILKNYKKELLDMTTSLKRYKKKEITLKELRLQFISFLKLLRITLPYTLPIGATTIFITTILLLKKLKKDKYLPDSFKEDELNLVKYKDFKSVKRSKENIKTFEFYIGENNKKDNERKENPIRTVDQNGTIEYRLNGKRHRDDGPAAEYTDGTKYWYKNGKLHRVDGPAVEWMNGSKEWWVNGKLHRLDGPAMEHPDGTKYWYKNGKLHCVDGPAMEWPDGRKEWWMNGKRYGRGRIERLSDKNPLKKSYIKWKYGIL